MIRVRAASRLHFGLFAPPPGETPAGFWANVHGQEVVPARRFGGVGLMVQAPGLEVSAAPAEGWSAEGPMAERALAFAQQIARTLPEARPHRLVVARGAPEHMGLGTGTQLGLAVACALAASHRLDLSAEELARRVGRGRRSALGVYGFARGGFLVEAGKRAAEAVAPLAARQDFPPEWRVVLVLPPWGQGLHGDAEGRALAGLHERSWPRAQTDALCRLVLLGMLPALAERDLRGFGEALYDFNRRVGEAFRAVQGGPYTHPRAAEVVEFVRQQGVPGVGQSSWGPALFAVAGDPERAAALRRRLCERFGLGGTEVLVTAACNRGTEAVIESHGLGSDAPAKADS
jgi:beta-RFAP synthase